MYTRNFFNREASMTDFTNFLTPEDEFKLEFERYFTEFMNHARMDTLETDESFKAWTIELMNKGEKLGLDLQQMVIDATKTPGQE
jgi:hypothetical protein